MGASMIEKCCLWCRRPFTARLADHKRGWARYCSKRCKASHQEARTGQNAAYLARRAELQRQADYEAGMDAMEAGWDGHKNVGP